MFLLFCLLCVFSGYSQLVEEGDEELEETGGDFSIVATEMKKEMLEGKTLVKKMVVEKHSRICHCKNYTESLREDDLELSSL